MSLGNRQNFTVSAGPSMDDMHLCELYQNRRAAALMGNYMMVQAYDEAIAKRKAAKDRSKDRNSPYYPITAQELADFGFQMSDKELKDWNALLKKEGITSPENVIAIMATAAEECGFGTDMIEGDPNKNDNLGAGMLQLTNADLQAKFLKEYKGLSDEEIEKINNKPGGYKKEIAEKYAQSSAAWVWGQKGNTNRIDKNGISLENFMIANYFIQKYPIPKGWTEEQAKKYKEQNGTSATDRDLNYIRNGGNYSIKNNELVIKHYNEKTKKFEEGRRYALPTNWDKRAANYAKACKVWG